MRRLATPLFLAAACFAGGCNESQSAYGASGIGSVELSDTAFAIHYYSATLSLGDATRREGLADGCRVYFVGSGWLTSESADGTQTYDFEPQTLSGDITSPALLLDSAGMASDSLMQIARSSEGFYGQNIHITRDWRRNDFLNATAIYAGTGDGSADFLGIVGDTMMAEADTLHLWLRLRRAQRDTTQMITKHVSVPFNCMRNSSKERLMVRLSRIDAAGDTVVTDMVYSYVNFTDRTNQDNRQQ